MIAIEPNPKAVPTHADLLDEVPRLAIAHVPLLFPLPKSALVSLSAKRDEHLEWLGTLPGAVRAWVNSEQPDAEVVRIAAERQRVAELPPDEVGFPASELYGERVWYPLTDSQRALLGERNARTLLFQAEETRGRSKGDPMLAVRLVMEKFEARPALVDQAVVLDKAVTAAAAHTALEIQNAIESARDSAREGWEPKVGGSFSPPIEEYDKELGHDLHSNLSQSSFLVAKRITDLNLDDSTVSRLANETRDAWGRGNFDPRIAERRAGLVDGRNAALGEGLEAVRRWAEDGNSSDRKFGEQRWKELNRKDKEFSELPKLGNPDRILQQDAIADALIHNASQQLLFERSLGMQGPDDGIGM